MTTPPTPLPRQNSPKVNEYDKPARILAGIVYLAYGFFARLTLLGLWIFTDLVNDAFTSWVIAAIGFVLLPWTTLTYVWLWLIGSDQVSGWEWIVVGTALVVDYLFWAWSRSAFR